MQACELLCEMVVPMMERTIGWADDSWAFRLWKSNPSNVMLEYMTFREIALQRKKCLTVAQFILERLTETGDERERASMSYYMNEAKRFERYMTMMIELGHPCWTHSIDESMWPSWVCSRRVVDANTLCKSMNANDCERECDMWAAQVIQSRPSQASVLDEWKVEAVKVVAQHWIDVSKNEVE